MTSAFDLLTKDITTSETQKKNEGVKEGIKKEGIPPGSDTKRTCNPNINTTKVSSIRGGQKCETHMLVNEDSNNKKSKTMNMEIEEITIC